MWFLDLVSPSHECSLCPWFLESTRHFITSGPCSSSFTFPFLPTFMFDYSVFLGPSLNAVFSKKTSQNILLFGICNYSPLSTSLEKLPDSFLTKSMSFFFLFFLSLCVTVHLCPYKEIGRQRAPVLFFLLLEWTFPSSFHSLGIVIPYSQI